MRRIPQINATINEANDKTRRAEAALGNAAADAKDAKAKAEEAEKIANDVQKVHETIKSWGVCFFIRKCLFMLTYGLIFVQGSAKTKADAEKAFEDTMKLDKDVDKMMDQLTAAEKELEKKKAEADTDMRMASMVGYID